MHCSTVRQRAFHAFSRSFSTTVARAETPKPSIQLVAELRKHTQVSISKAREALTASNLDIKGALAWLETDMAASGASKAAKIAGRTAQQGLVALHVLSPGVLGTSSSASDAGRGGVRAAMIELNCETDFVARNALFGTLAANIAHTAAVLASPVDDASAFFRASPSLDDLLAAPLIPAADPAAVPTTTVGDAVHQTIARLGEKVSLRRVIGVARDPPPSPLAFALGSYVHGSVGDSNRGRVGGLVLAAVRHEGIAKGVRPAAAEGTDGLPISPINALSLLARSLARQAVGFDTRVLDNAADASDLSALLNQPFMMLATDLHKLGQGETSANERTVREVLDLWAERYLAARGDINMLDFARWVVGEPVESEKPAELAKLETQE